MRFVVPVRGPQSYAGRLTFAFGCLLGALCGIPTVWAALAPWLDRAGRKWGYVAQLASYWQSALNLRIDYGLLAIVLLPTLLAILLAYPPALSGRQWERFLQAIFGSAFVFALLASFAVLEAIQSFLNLISGFGSESFDLYRAVMSATMMMGDRIAACFVAGAGWLIFCASFAWWHELRQETLIQGDDDIRPVEDDDERTLQRRRRLVAAVAAGGAPLTALGLQFLLLPLVWIALLMGAVDFVDHIPYWTFEYAGMTEYELSAPPLLLAAEFTGDNTALRISINNEGTVSGGGYLLGQSSDWTLQNLTAYLKIEIEKRGSVPEVLLTVDPDVRHERLVSAVSAMRKAKCRRVFLLDAPSASEPPR